MWLTSLELETLLTRWRDRIQAFCFYWKESRKRGKCKEMNGSYCVFCELADGFDKDIKELKKQQISLPDLRG